MWGRRILSLVIGCSLGLMLCEILARIVFPAPPYPFREPSLVYVRDPQVSYFHQPNQVGWIDDGQATINSLGLRGAEPARPKPASIFRILVMGDSLTFGWGVNDDETFCQQLQSSLIDGLPARRVEVVNAGVSGYATNQEAALLERLAPELQPDLILLGFYWNDLLMSGTNTSNGAAEDVSTLESFAATRGDGTLRMVPTEPWWKRELRHSRAAFVAGRGLTRLFGAGEWGASYTGLEAKLLEGRQTPEIDRRWLRVEQELGKMSEVAKQQKCQFGVIVLPSRQQVGGDYPAAQIQSKISEIAQRIDYFVIDPLPKLREHRSQVDKLYIAYDRHHPTAQGHQIIAEEIAEVLKTRDLLPAN
jgi:lysophospholipase L1-like esterase